MKTIMFYLQKFLSAVLCRQRLTVYTKYTFFIFRIIYIVFTHEIYNYLFVRFNCRNLFVRFQMKVLQKL